MNSLLAGTLEILNSIFAALIIIFSTVFGYINPFDFVFGFNVIGAGLLAFFGFICGLIIAAIFCGFLATILDIRRQLIIFNQSNNLATTSKRIEPTL